jgi:hypothetical protein
MGPPRTSSISHVISRCWPLMQVDRSDPPELAQSWHKRVSVSADRLDCLGGRRCCAAVVSVAVRLRGRRGDVLSRILAVAPLERSYGWPAAWCWSATRLPRPLPQPPLLWALTTTCRERDGVVSPARSAGEKSRVDPGEAVGQLVKVGRRPWKRPDQTARTADVDVHGAPGRNHPWRGAHALQMGVFRVTTASTPGGARWCRCRRRPGGR